MANDLISRQAAIDDLHGKDPSQVWDTADVEVWINSFPSAQPETAKRIVGKSRNGMTLWYQCDNCNEPVDENDLYCRGCGRRFEHGSD